MKRLFLAFLFVCLTAGAQMLVTLGGPVQNADGSMFTGDIQVSSDAVVCGGVPIRPLKQTIHVVAGTLSVKLLSLADCGMFYTAKYPSGPLRYWSVPSTSPTTTVGAVEALSRPVVSLGTTGPQGPQGPPGASTATFSTSFSTLAYNVGVVELVSGSTDLVGTGTNWDASMVGQYFIGPGYLVQIVAYISPTELTLTIPWPGVSQSNVIYSIAQSVFITADVHGLGQGPFLIQVWVTDPATGYSIYQGPNACTLTTATGDVFAIFRQSVQGTMVISAVVQDLNQSRSPSNLGSGGASNSPMTPTIKLTI